MPLSRRGFLLGTSATATLGALTGCAPTDGGQQSVWSTYGVGTGTYNDLAAVRGMGPARLQKYGEKILEVVKG